MGGYFFIVAFLVYITAVQPLITKVFFIRFLNFLKKVLKPVFHTATLLSCKSQDIVGSFMNRTDTITKSCGDQDQD
jgi:hypothetical protein